jgi:hypothetical protein
LIDPASQRSRILSRKVSGGADDWMVFKDASGATFVGSKEMENHLPAKLVSQLLHMESDDEEEKELTYLSRRSSVLL